MTDVGYDFILSKITGRLIESPDHYNVDMLSAWLSGYAQCQHDIIEVIEEMRRGDERH